MISHEAIRDQQLIRQALAGNQEGFQLLLKLYWNFLKNWFQQKRLKREEAEDLALLTFSKAFTKLRQYRNKYAFKSWLMQIAQNNFVDYLRKQSREVPTDTLEAHKPDEFVQEFNPEQEMLKKERYNQVHKLLKKINPSYHKLIILRFIEERSYKEIAAELNWPLGTVKAKIFRAKRQLKKIFRSHKAVF